MNIKYTNEDFWKNYMINWFGKELIDKWKKYAKVVEIDSAGGKIQVELYKNIDVRKPSIVFAHGIAGYARVLLPFIIPLYEKGYNIIAPDLEGFGYNKREKGDFTWDIHLQNLRDTVNYAKSLFNKPVFLGGASMGGPLAYAADARYNCADGLICWCLWNLSDKEFLNKETSTKQFTTPMMPLFRLFAALFGKMRLKTYRFISYDTLSKSKEFNDLVKADPQAGTLITLRGVAGLITHKNDIKYKDYDKPVLLCQPEQDKMIPAYYSKKTFEDLKSAQKKYCAFNEAHFPINKEVYEEWGRCVDCFIKEVFV